MTSKLGDVVDLLGEQGLGFLNSVGDLAKSAGGTVYGGLSVSTFRLCMEFVYISVPLKYVVYILLYNSIGHFTVAHILCLYTEQ